jgi:hypothetical protein
MSSKKRKSEAFLFTPGSKTLNIISVELETLDTKPKKASLLDFLDPHNEGRVSVVKPTARDEINVVKLIKTVKRS